MPFFSAVRQLGVQIFPSCQRQPTSDCRIWGPPSKTGARESAGVGQRPAAGSADAVPHVVVQTRPVATNHPKLAHEGCDAEQSPRGEATRGLLGPARALISGDPHVFHASSIIYFHVRPRAQPGSPQRRSRETGPDVVEIFGFHSRGHEHGVVCNNRAVLVAGGVSDGSRRSYCGLEISR